MTVVRAVTDAEIRIRADVLQSMNTAVRQVVTPGREVQAAGAQGEVHGTGEEDVASAHPVREAFPPKWMKEARVQTEAGASPSSPPAPAEGRGEVEVGHGKAGKAGDKGKEQEGTGGKGKTKSSIPAPSKPSRPLPPKKGSHTHSQSMQAAPATQEEGVQVEAHTAEVASGPEQAVQREEEQASAAVQDAPDSQADTAQPAPTPGAEGEGEGEGGQLAGKTTGSLFTSTRRGDPAAAHRARLAAARQKASLPPPSAAIMQVHPSLSSSHPHVVSRVQEGIRKGSAGSAGGAPAQPATHRGPDPGTRGGAAGTAESGREGPRTSPTPSPSTTTGRKPWSGTGGAAMSTSGRRTHSMPPTSKGLQAAPARGGPTASTVAADAKVEQPTEDTAFDATTAQTVEREGEGEREQQQDVGGGQSPELEAGQVKEAASSPPGSMSEETWARLTSTTAGRRRRCSACSEELDTSILGTTAADGHVHRAGKGDPWTQMEAGPSMTGKGQQQGDEGEGQEALVEADEGTADV